MPLLPTRCHNSDFGEDCEFNFSLIDRKLAINQDKTSFKTEKLHLKFCINFKCSELEKFVTEGIASFFLRIVVNRSKYRIVLPLQEAEIISQYQRIFEADIPTDSLFGSFDIEILLVATNNARWEHKDIDGDIVDLKLVPGRICAFGKLPGRFEIVRSEAHIRLMSIFSLRKVLDETVREGVVTCLASEAMDKLEICVDKNNYDKLAIVAKNSPQTFKDKIVLPALISVLSQVYSTPSEAENGNSVDCFKDTLWLQVIESALGEFKINIHQRTIQDALHDAQLLLDFPAKRIEEYSHE